MSANTNTDESFRDAISTVDKDGKRVWIYPKMPKGRFYDRRKILSYLLLAFLFSAPFIKIGGAQLLMFNVLEQKFAIFGKVFWPQDFFIFALITLAGLIAIALFTVIFGRLFCGWVCPQTIFMEMLFRRIEYWLEGDHTHQRKLDKQEWNTDKVLKKSAKHLIFWLISFLIANVFLAYLIGSDLLLEIVTTPPHKHLGGFMGILVFSTIFYLVFSKFREQVCTVVCPYGRLQGVLLDRKSLVVAYDYIRGEKRAKFKKGEERATAEKGDCIDCSLCVKVCPTGIDIRNGTQLECVNCTACIDACDEVMDGVGLDRGLIRYASEDGIAKKEPFRITKRAIAYSSVLVLLMVIIASLLVTRSNVQATILRTRGTMHQKLPDGSYANIYDINLINKTTKDIPIELKILKGEGEIRLIGKELEVAEQSELQSKMMIVIPKEKMGNEIKLTIGIYSDGELIQKVKTTFIGPLL
ncbi:MAG: cytochrome c oxidase accessory protein CcoG [Flavobacteriales bacterium]